MNKHPLVRKVLDISLVGRFLKEDMLRAEAALYQNSGFGYPGMLIYIMAMYSFYATIMAVRNVIKFRRYGSPVMSAAKIINLTAALVSMLSLETAMLTRFGDAGNPMFRQIMTASTGAGISAIVLGMGVFMIVRSTKQLRCIKQGKAV